MRNHERLKQKDIEKTIYFNSPEWLEFQGKILERDEFTCQRCKAEAKEAYPKLFNNWKSKNCQDFECLCMACRITQKRVQNGRLSHKS